MRSTRAASASVPNRSATPDRALPTPTDHRRYRAHRAGQTDDEIAAADRVTPAAVRASLLRVRIDNARYSSDEAGVAVRKLLFSRLPQIGAVLDEALRATKIEGRKVIVITDGKAETLDEQIERPDHDTRLRTIDTTRALLAVVQPRDPAVQINSNSQTNILNQGAQAAQLGAGAGAGLANLTSPEAVIRAIRAERELRLTDGSGGSLASPKGPERLNRPVGPPVVIDAEVEAGAEDADADDEDAEYDEADDEEEDEDDPDSEEDDSQ